MFFLSFFSAIVFGYSFLRLFSEDLSLVSELSLLLVASLAGVVGSLSSSRLDDEPEPEPSVVDFSELELLLPESESLFESEDDLSGAFFSSFFFWIQTYILNVPAKILLETPTT